MQAPKPNYKWPYILGMVVFILVFRLLPHWPNVSPMGAFSMHTGANFKSPAVGFGILLFAAWLSDFAINNILYGSYYQGIAWFTPGFLYIYLAYGVVFLIGRYIVRNRLTYGTMVLASLLGSVAFFLISNFGVWRDSLLYPHTWQGLLACYAMALPYFGGTLFGDMLFNGILFGATAYLGRKIKQVQEIFA